VTGRAAWDEEARNGITDLARRDEELRRRIEGRIGAGSEGSESGSDSDELSDSEAEEARLDSKLKQLEHTEDDTTESRLASMAFMKKAEAARRARNDEEIRDIQRSLKTDDFEFFDDHPEEEVSVGRRAFGVNNKPQPVDVIPRVEKSEFEERASEDEDEMAARHEGVSPLGQQRLDQGAVESKTVSTAGTASKRRMNGQASAPISKTTAGTGDRDHATTSQAAKAPKHKSKPSESQLDDYTSPSESEDGEDSRAALARSIFAGPDEVIQDFAKEKKKTVEDEEDKVIDNSLPGWGSWTGNGISKKAQKRAKGKFLTTIKGVSEDKRKDAKLDRVIINEKRVKKNDKYLATELPHPFESRAQYERSLRLPLGPEFQTKISFQDAIKPRLLMKQGIIKPMARPSA
jgi:U3 small nucleolar RNA-associated protein 14